MINTKWLSREDKKTGNFFRNIYYYILIEIDNGIYTLKGYNKYDFPSPGVYRMTETMLHNDFYQE